jgi:hypothetical protein
MTSKASQDLEDDYKKLIAKTQTGQDMFNAFKLQVERDITTLRNLTYKALYQSQAESSTSSVDDSVYTDIQRLHLELRQFQAVTEDNMETINKFKTTAKDVSQTLWDHVNELQEITNVTTRNIEYIYDKDILVLQNFKSATENEMSKLREEMEDFLLLAGPGSGGKTNTSEEAIKVLNKTKKRMDLLEEEQKRHKLELEKFQESQTLSRNEILRIFEDIDAFKKQGQSMVQNQLKLERELQRLEDVKITDVNNVVDSHTRQLEDLSHFKEKALGDFGDAQSNTEDKFMMVVKEMQAIKSQIYYLQQSVLQLRGAFKSEDFGSATSTTEGSVVPIPPGRSSSNLSTSTSLSSSSIEAKLESCAAQSDLQSLQSVLESKTLEFTEALELLNGQLETVSELTTVLEEDVTSVKNKTDIQDNKISQIEAHAKKYNLIIRGMKQDKRLERPSHLEELVKQFFEHTLELPGVQFDEVKFG